MTSDQFAYWLQGFTELHGEPPTAAQWQMIKDHLSLVFKKVTPAYAPNAVPVTPSPMTPGLPPLSPLWPNPTDRWATPPPAQCAGGKADTYC